MKIKVFDMNKFKNKLKITKMYNLKKAIKPQSI